MYNLFTVSLTQVNISNKAFPFSIKAGSGTKPMHCFIWLKSVLDIYMQPNTAVIMWVGIENNHVNTSGGIIHEIKRVIL